MQEVSKIYIVYVLPPFINDTLEDDLKSRLDLTMDISYPRYFYCWTTKKKILKNFLKYRNKNRFIIEKHDILNDKLSEFRSKNYETEIVEDPSILDTVSSRIKGCGNPPNGIVQFKFTLTKFEQDTIYGTMEWFDDHIVEDFSDHSLAVMSILVKCANKELKKALYNSDILNTIMYIDFLHNGVYEMVDPNEKCDDYPFTWMMDEVYLLLNFYGELFKF